MVYRTPKHFDGTKRPGLKIDELLPSLLAEITKKTADPKDAVFQEWFMLVGEKMAPFTQPVSLKEWVLTVKVKSSTLYSLLCQHEKPRLLRGLQKKFPMRDLVFRAG